MTTTTNPLNGVSPALALLQSLWTTRPARTVRMQLSGAKYITLKDPQGADITLTDVMLAEHLTGQATYGASLIGADGLAKAIVWELDTGGAQTAQQVLEAARLAGLTAWAIVCPGSGGHDGAHIWCVYAQAWNPERLQAQARQVLSAAGLPHKEVYPSNAAIRLPFGFHVRSQRRGTLVLQGCHSFDLDTHDGLVAAITAVCALPGNTQAPPAAPSATGAYVSYTRSAGDISPLDDYDQRTTRQEVEQLLLAHNWTEGRSQGSVAYWIRPGKTAREGHSATLGHVADTVLSVFSESDPRLPGEAGQGKHYGPAKLYTHLVHAGDFSAAAKDLYAQGYGTRVQERSQPLPTPTAPSISRAMIFKCLGEDEAGDAQLIEALYRNRLCYDTSAGIWYTFEGHSWTPYAGPPRKLVWSTVAAIYLELAAKVQAEAKPLDDIDPKKAEASKSADLLIERAKKLRNLRRISNVLTLAQELLKVSGEQWDADPWILAVENGVLDLRTGQLRDGQPDDYIRLVAPTPWTGLDTPAPRWERFVREVLSDEADRVAFLQRLLGFALNGTTKEHVLAVCVGERGRNGKRVLFETLQHVLGRYAGSVSTDVLIGQDRWRSPGSAQPHLMDLQGRRIAYASETAENDQLSTAQVKNITGGDPITARRLHENLVTFLPTHTIFLQTNRKPQAPPDDDALWERVKVLEFKVRFVDQPQAADERQRDPDLEDALRAEASGILAWLVRGHIDWQQHGLQTPTSVKLARDKYRQEENIEAFLEVACVEADGVSAEGGALYEAYKRWAEACRLRPKNPNWFGRELAKRFEKGRITAGINQGRTCYYGVGLETTEFPSLSTEGSLQEAHVPSVGIETPHTPAETEGTEGTMPFPKLNASYGPHEGKKLEMPSVPSVPSVEPPSVVTLAPGVEQPRIVPDRIVVSNGRIQELIDSGLTREEAQRQAVEEAREQQGEQAQEVAPDPLARVDWPSVHTWLAGGQLAPLQVHCSMRRVAYDEVLAEAFRRWPELLPAA